MSFPKGNFMRLFPELALSISFGDRGLSSENHKTYHKSIQGYYYSQSSLYKFKAEMVKFLCPLTRKTSFQNEFTLLSNKSYLKLKHITEIEEICDPLLEQELKELLAEPDLKFGVFLIKKPPMVPKPQQYLRIT